MDGLATQCGMARQAAVFDPITLSPVLWLSDTGTNPGLWEDQSGNGHHATQVVTSYQPAIISNAINGRQVRRFDGNDWLESGSNSTWNFLHNGTTSRVFVVANFEHDGLSDARYSFLSTGGEATAQIGYGILFDFFPPLGRFNSLHAAVGRGILGQYAVTDIVNYAITPNQYNIITHVIDADNSTPSLRSQSRVNGLDLPKNNNLTNPPSTANSTNPLQIGAYNSGAALSLVGDIAEILVFSNGLTNSERDQIEGYLSAKYNILI